MTLTADAGINTDVVIQPAQDVRIGGDMDLAAKPSWGSGGFTVQDRASLVVAHVVLNSDLTIVGGGSARLSACTLGATFSVTLSTGDGPVSLGLASMAVPVTILATALAQQVLSGTGSALRLSAVTVPEFPDQGALTGTATVGVGGSTAIDPAGWGLTGAPKFLVVSGPCTVSEGGRCVGRALGYMPDEACTIVVGGGLGVLGACGVFDTVSSGDYVTLPDGSSHYNADCPAGVALSPVAPWLGRRTANYKEASRASKTVAAPRPRVGCVTANTALAAGSFASPSERIFISTNPFKKLAFA